MNCFKDTCAPASSTGLERARAGDDGKENFLSFPSFPARPVRNYRPPLCACLRASGDEAGWIIQLFFWLRQNNLFVVSGNSRGIIGHRMKEFTMKGERWKRWKRWKVKKARLVPRNCRLPFPLTIFVPLIYPEWLVICRPISLCDELYCVVLKLISYRRRARVSRLKLISASITVL